MVIFSDGDAAERNGLLAGPALGWSIIDRFAAPATPRKTPTHRQIGCASSRRADADVVGMRPESRAARLGRR